MNKEERIAHKSALARIAELEAALAARDELLKSKDRKIEEQGKAIAEREKAIAEKDRLIADAKRFLIEQKIMNRKAVNALFGKSSAKTKNLAAKAIADGGRAPIRKEAAKAPGKVGRKAGTKDFLWVEGCYAAERVKAELLDRSCPSCGAEMALTGFETYSKIYVVSEHLRKVEHLIAVYRCPECGETARAEEGGKADAFGRSACTPGLAGLLAMMSCGLYLPAKRISDLTAMAGTPISRELVTRYLIRAGSLLAGFAEGMRKEMQGCSALMADETVWDSLEDEGENRIWGITSGPREEIKAAYYLYSPNRKYENLGKLIDEDYAGTVVSDAYGAYLRCAAHQLCWSHLRKYLFDYLKALGCPGGEDYGEVKGLLDKANLVFAKERELSSLPEPELARRRESELRPLIDGYFASAEAICDMGAGDPKNRAIAYGLRRKSEYYTLVSNPKVPATNNASERSMRKAVMKRVGSLFSASTKGAEAMCVLLSLCQSALMNGLSPDAYIKHLLENIDDISDGRSAKRYMPWSKSLPKSISFDPKERMKAAEEVEKDLARK